MFTFINYPTLSTSTFITTKIKICSSSSKYYIPTNPITTTIHPIASQGNLNSSTKTASNGVAPIHPQQTKQNLLQILSSVVNTDTQTNNIEKLILDLESLKATPITELFTELALEGEWNLLFSTSKPSSKDNIRVRQVSQTFDSLSKTMINEAIWSYIPSDDQPSFDANLLVICSYQFVGPGQLQINLKEHKVNILSREDGQKINLPDDFNSVITDLRISLPREFFDPTGLLDVTYMEPSFRLTRLEGKHAASVRNIFVRKDSNLSSLQ